MSIRKAWKNMQKWFVYDDNTPKTDAFDNLDYIFYTNEEYNHLMDTYDDNSIHGMNDRLDYIFMRLQEQIKAYDPTIDFEFHKTAPVRNEEQEKENFKKGRSVWTIKSDIPNTGYVSLSLQQFIGNGSDYSPVVWKHSDLTEKDRIAAYKPEKYTVIQNFKWVDKDQTIECIDFTISHAFSPAFKDVIIASKQHKEREYRKTLDGQDPEQGSYVL